MCFHVQIFCISFGPNRMPNRDNLLNYNFILHLYACISLIEGGRCRVLIKPAFICILTVIMWDWVAVWCFYRCCFRTFLYLTSPTHQHKQAGSHTHMQLHTRTHALLPGTLNTAHSLTQSNHFPFSIAKYNVRVQPYSLLPGKNPFFQYWKIELKGKNIKCNHWLWHQITKNSP